MLTGYLISIYQDINPASLTYGQTRTERELSSDCPEGSGDPNYQITNRYCEMNSSHMKTGYLIVERTDVNPDSATYGDIQTTRTENHTECPPDTTNPNWVDTGEASCEQIQYQSGAYGNSGYKLQVQTDVNQFSSTYMQTRTQRTQDLTTCPLPNTQPVWQIISEECNVISINNSTGFDGTKTITRIDTNVYSSTYTGVPETTVVTDTVNCPPSNTNPQWIEINRYCEVSNGANTGYLIIVQKDINPLSSTYNTTQTSKIRDTISCPTGSTPSSDISLMFEIRNTCNRDAIGGRIRLNYGDIDIEFDNTILPGASMIGSILIPDSYNNTPLELTSAAIMFSQSVSRYQVTQSPTPYVWSTETSTLTFTIEPT